MARRQVAAQASLLVASTAGAGLLAIAAQALLARELGVADFAVYAFCFAYLQLSSGLFEFGLFVPAARRTAIATPGEAREIIGAAISLYVPVGLAFSGFILLTSLFINSIIELDAAASLALVAVAAWSFPFPLIGQWLAQGAGRLHVFSITSLAWQVLFVLAIVGIELAEIGLESAGAVLLRGVTLAFGVVALCVWLRPHFAEARAWRATLVKDARAYGFSIYVGRVLSTGTYNMDVFLVAAFADVEAVAFYALARALAAAVALPGLGVSSALFQRFAAMASLPRRWVGLGLLGSLAGAGALALIADPLIEFAYSAPFVGAAGLVATLAFAEALRAGAGFYNQYMSAHGRGRALRTCGLILTMSNLTANLILIPIYGAQGAAWASLIAMAINLLAHAHVYRRTVYLPAGEG